MSIELQRDAERVNDLIPVAKPAAPRPHTRADHDAELPPEGTVLTPSSLKGWATSIGLHALLLLLFGLWVFTPPRNDVKAFDTRIGGDGSPGGGGDSGGLAALEGMDKTLTLEPPPTPVEVPLNTLTASEVALDPSAVPKASAKNLSVNGGGLELGNPGSGGGGGQGDGFGPAKFGNGSENIGGISVKVGDPQFTLIWTSAADLDIHIIEPGGAEIYWEKPHGGQGGELDVDDVDGYGPENVYWVQGQGPPGEYRWFVHYYGGLGGLNVPTNWKVRLKHNGQVTVYKGRLNSIGARSKIHTLSVDRGPSGDKDGVARDTESAK